MELFSGGGRMIKGYEHYTEEDISHEYWKSNPQEKRRLSLVLKKLRKV
jgi:hypothetical protein